MTEKPEPVESIDLMNLSYLPVVAAKLNELVDVVNRQQEEIWALRSNVGT